MRGINLMEAGMCIRNVVANAFPWQHGEDQPSRSSAMVRQYAAVPKKATNVSLAEALLTEAKHLGVNVSQAAEAGLAQAVADRRAEEWQKENAEAIQAWNVYVDEHGLPLDQYRMF
jgi:antitoxin CcdA